MLELVIVSVLSLGGVPAQDVQQPASGIKIDRPARQHGRQQLFPTPPITVPGLPAVTPKRDHSAPQPRHIEVFGPKDHSLSTGPCNMPIVVGDSSVDPGILIVKKRSHHESKMRIVAPPACGEKQQ